MSDRPIGAPQRDTRAAAAWGHGQTIRPLGESLAYQLRRLSLTNKPTLVKLVPVLDAEESEGAGAAVA